MPSVAKMEEAMQKGDLDRRLYFSKISRRFSTNRKRSSSSMQTVPIPSRAPISATYATA